MAICLCCSHPMQRHIQKHHIHWFCRHCWQVMPAPQLDTSHFSESLNALRQADKQPLLALAGEASL